MISDLNAGVVNIQRVISNQYQHNFQDFEVFLQVLESYGTGYADDVDTKNYKIREKVSHRKQTIRNLKDIQKIYDISIRQLNDK